MTQPIEPNEIGRLLGRHAASLELYASQWSVVPEDCVQEAFIELAAQLSRPEVPLAWLYRVVRNRAINTNRSARRRANHERLAAMLLDSRRTTGSKLANDRNSVMIALESLTGEERELIVLRIWSGLTWQQIADLRGSSSSGSQRQYVIALRKLKELMEPSCPKNLKFRTT